MRVLLWHETATATTHNPGTPHTTHRAAYSSAFFSEGLMVLMRSPNNVT